MAEHPAEVTVPPQSLDRLRAKTTEVDKCLASTRYLHNGDQITVYLNSKEATRINGDGTFVVAITCNHRLEPDEEKAKLRKCLEELFVNEPYPLRSETTTYRTRIFYNIPE